jgi:hypothetical protein
VELRKITQLKVYRRWNSKFAGDSGSGLCASNDLGRLCDVNPDEAAIAATGIGGMYSWVAWATEIAV